MFNSLTRIMGDVDQENESKSLGSCEHLDAAAADHDDDPVQENPRKKKKKKQKCCSYRHTPLQIQELEARFKESSHPDEKQRIELGKRVGLEPQQVKFWFQNRRTLMKAQLERHENTFLKQENEKLRVENIAMREAMRNPMCTDCGCGPAIARELPTEEEQLKIENARLKDELDRVLALAGRFMHNPMSFSLLELAVGFTPNNLSSSSLSSNIITSSMLGTPRSNFGGLVERCIGRSVFFELAMSAMDELVKMAQMEEPLWSYDITTGKENLNYQEYLQAFPRCIGVKPAEFVSEATRDTGMVIINSLALVDTLMDAKRWADMFPGMIARAATTDIISSCVAGTKDGALQLMHAELQVLSPLVQTRDVSFLRYCKRLSEGVWAVVDVSIDETMTRESSSGDGITDMIKCRRLPSGCVVQDMPDGYSKVTWVEHAEYDDSAVHQLYRSLLRSGMGLGAQRWLATLQRRCECLAVLLSNSIPTADQDTAITPAGRRSMLELAQRMMDNFCGGVCASSSRKWNKFVSPKGNVLGEDVRVMTRQSPDDPGEPPGVVLSAATSVWLPVSPQRLFDFLRDANLRSKWDVLSNGAPMQEVAHIAKGQDDGNAVSLLRSSGVSENQGKNNMLILQETCTDASGSLVVYAPVDTPAMHLMMNGGDSAVALLPSGFSIVTDGATVGPAHQKLGGSLLMVAFQILVNTLPSAKLTVESVETVSNLMSCTIQKIKAALNTED